MLTCQQVTARATALLEDELSFRERLSIRLHLAMCVHCRRFLRQLRRLIARMHRQEREHPASEQFVAQVLNAVEKERSEAGGVRGPGS